MVKTYKELGLQNKSFFQGEDMIVSMTRAKEINSPALQDYINTGYQESDYDQIQKVIKYVVVRWIKTDRQLKNIYDCYKRWKYVKDLYKEYNEVFPDKQFNTKSFDRMKDELISYMF